MDRLHFLSPSIVGEAAPFLPDVLGGALEAQLPGIAWMAEGTVPGEVLLRRTLFTFGNQPFDELKPDDTGLISSFNWLEDQLSPEEPFGCGYVLLLPYEAGEWFHPRLQPTGLVPIRYRRVDACYVSDLETRTSWITFSSMCDLQRRTQFKAAIDQLAERAVLSQPSVAVSQPFDCSGEFSRAEYETIVSRVEEDILSGRYYELNFTQRFRRKSVKSPSDVAARLLAQPAKHAAYFDAGDEHILSNSPELFLRRSGKRVLTGPIKGTRHPDEVDPFPVGEKDHAEHTMVLDMARNDLGRICEPGTVKVTSGYTTERHPHLAHLVSGVEGHLRDNISMGELLQATYPAASITGAPKVEVMSAIREYERSPRGLYTGSIGWWGRDYLELNVAIRTLVARSEATGFSYELGSGGAVVADSNPTAEYEECLMKIRPLLKLL